MKYFNHSTVLVWIWLCVSIVCEQIVVDFEGEKAESLAEKYQSLSDSSLFWGPYRSGLYFGLRPRVPRSLLSGLMWYNVDDYSGLRKIRHFYEQNDPMQKANWVYYDPRFGGRQVIIDKESHIKLTIDFVKTEDGFSWSTRVRVKPQKGYENVKTAFIWYSGLESEVLEKDMYGQESNSGILRMDLNPSPTGGYNSPILLSGAAEHLGLFKMIVGEGSKVNRRPKGTFPDPELDPSQNHHLSLRVPNDNVWQAKDIFMTLLQDSIKDLMEKYEQKPIPPEQSFIMRDLQKYEGNLHIVQQIFEGEAEFFVRFESSLTPEEHQITVENFDEKINKAVKSFNQKFKKHFNLVAPFNDKKYEPFAKEILSGLLGGISYFYGEHMVDRETKLDEESFDFDLGKLDPKPEGPHELFTLVPSRPFFPRGFLWDEGFHLLPLLEYDSDLVLEILKSWFNLIDDDGWIAREQILGPELRSRVPRPFEVQSPEIVNPPTLMLVFTFLLNNVESSVFGEVDSPKHVDGGVSFLEENDLGNLVLNNPEVLKNYTRDIYPKLKSHYEMFRRTQKGFYDDFGRNKDMEIYRWRGRTETHSLASGLDDYPRALPVDIAELNVDLLSWIGVMTRSVKLIAKVLGEEEDIKKYQEIEDKIVDSLNSVHWSDQEGVYCDKSVDEDDEDVFVCYKGYISLFPFITKMMRSDDFDKIEKLVDFIANPEELWTDYGLRSVSKSDPTYKTGENYWRSPIWININYLVVDALKHYKELAINIPKDLLEKLSTIYHDLRINIVNNIHKQWESTGFVWEQYDDETGAAKGAKNFLGWTSTVILLMKMPETI